MGVRPLHQFLILHQHRGTEPTGAAILPGPFTAIAIGIGQFTPPVGVNLFVASRVLNVSIEDTVREIPPFLLISFLGLFLIYLFPALSIWLPSTMR